VLIVHQEEPSKLGRWTDKSSVCSAARKLRATAGAAIKKAYPLVVVTVVDKDEHTTEIINA
jgi:hypothetical protein